MFFFCSHCLLIFCSRWMALTLNTAFQGRRRWALHPILATHAGTASPWVPLTQGTVLRTGTHPHRRVARGQSKALAWRITSGNCLTSVPPLPFHPPRWLPHSVCSMEHKGARHSRVCQFLLLWVAEDAAWQRRAGAWGRTLLLWIIE